MRREWLVFVACSCLCASVVLIFRALRRTPLSLQELGIPTNTLGGCPSTLWWKDTWLLQHVKESMVVGKDYKRYARWCVKARTCLTVQVRNGQMYLLAFKPGYQSRHKAVMMHLLRVSETFPDLPDALLTVDVGDGMYENKHHIFVADRYVRKDGRPNGVMSPDFTFYSWPESECPLDTSHSLDLCFRHLPRGGRCSHVG